MTATPVRDRVTRVDAAVRASEPAGDYRRLTLVAPEIAVLATPGQFVALAIDGADSALLLRRSFSIHRVSADAGTVEIVVADAGPGTRWITRLRAGGEVSVVGPLGRGFTSPSAPRPCILVGGGYGSAPLFWLAESLRVQGCSTHLILGAATERRLFGARSGADSVDEMVVMTDDGSAGATGLVTQPLPELLTRTHAEVVYACGPMGMLRAVTEIAEAHGAQAQVAVEEAMACGVGVCMTCVLPITGDDGITRMSRSCLDGPVFTGTAVRWDVIADGRVAVPADCLGAPAVTP